MGSATPAYMERVAVEDFANLICRAHAGSASAAVDGAAVGSALRAALARQRRLSLGERESALPAERLLPALRSFVGTGGAYLGELAELLVDKYSERAGGRTSGGLTASVDTRALVEDFVRLVREACEEAASPKVSPNELRRAILRWIQAKSRTSLHTSLHTSLTQVSQTSHTSLADVSHKSRTSLAQVSHKSHT